MARIGVAEIYTEANGWMEIELHEEGTFEFEPLEFPAVSGQAGYPYLRDPDEADTPIEFYTQSRGWVGVNSLGIQPIDDFEHGNMVPYYAFADTADPLPETRQEAARTGNYGWYGTGDARTFSLPEGHPNYDPSLQSDFLPNYPESGDIFEMYMNVVDTNPTGGTNGINRFHWGVQDYEEGNPSGGYRIFWDLDGGYWRIERLGGGSSTTLQGNGSLPFNSWPQNEWLRFVIDWRGSGFTVYAYRENGSLIDSLSTNDTQFTSGGIGYDNGNYATSYTDDWQIIPELP